MVCSQLVFINRRLVHCMNPGKAFVSQEVLPHAVPPYMAQLKGVSPVHASVDIPESHRLFNS